MRYISGITKMKSLIKRNKRDIENGSNDIYTFLIKWCDRLIKEEKDFKKKECSHDFIETGLSGDYFCYKCNLHMTDYFKNNDPNL